jgi:hypothetical protein
MVTVNPMLPSNSLRWEVEDIPAVGEALDLGAGIDGDPAEPNIAVFAWSLLQPSLPPIDAEACDTVRSAPIGLLAVVLAQTRARRAAFRRNVSEVSRVQALWPP